MTSNAMHTVPGLDISVEVETPEQVALSYSVAGIGSRGAAAALDALICLGILVAVAAALLIAASYSGVETMQRTPRSGTWLMVFWIIFQFGITWGYYVLFEGIWDGQTPGKRMMKLRVVRDGGFSVTFGASAVRNLLRVVDAFGFYLVAIIVAMANRSRKRLGDIVAGTFVIREERQQGGISGVTNSDRKSPTTFARLSDDEYRVLERFMDRRMTLEPARREAIVAQLATRLSAFLPPRTASTRSADLLRLYESERDARASGVASRSDTGAQREQHAIAAMGLKRWNDFSAALDAAYDKGLARMPASEVSALVSQYREVATDMARLQTASRGRENDALFHVSRLVARGHNLLYRQRGKTLASFVTYIMETVPTEVRRSWRPIALAVLLLFGPAIASYVVVQVDPKVAVQLLPDEMISRAMEANARQKRGEGYVTIPDDMRPVAASSIISNNVKVTYLAFAMGVTFGIGTAFMLIFNGVAIGSSVGLFASEGVARLIVAFIAPHGVLELSAICIAGGGGLLLAAAILLPGNRTRRDALVENGRRAINLIAASTLLLLVAGTLEGLVSPRVWPLEWKLWISGATAVLMLGYLSLGWSNSGKEKVVGGEERTPDRVMPAV